MERIDRKLCIFNQESKTHMNESWKPKFNDFMYFKWQFINRTYLILLIKYKIENGRTNTLSTIIWCQERRTGTLDAPRFQQRLLSCLWHLIKCVDDVDSRYSSKIFILFRPQHSVSYGNRCEWQDWYQINNSCGYEGTDRGVEQQPQGVDLDVSSSLCAISCAQFQNVLRKYYTGEPQHFPINNPRLQSAVQTRMFPRKVSRM